MQKALAVLLLIILCVSNVITQQKVPTTRLEVVKLRQENKRLRKENKKLRKENRRLRAITARQKKLSVSRQKNYAAQRIKTNKRNYRRSLKRTTAKLVHNSNAQSLKNTPAVITSVNSQANLSEGKIREIFREELQKHEAEKAKQNPGNLTGVSTNANNDNSGSANTTGTDDRWSLGNTFGVAWEWIRQNSVLTTLIAGITLVLLGLFWMYRRRKNNRKPTLKTFAIERFVVRIKDAAAGAWYLVRPKQSMNSIVSDPKDIPLHEKMYPKDEILADVQQDLPSPDEVDEARITTVTARVTAEEPKSPEVKKDFRVLEPLAKAKDKNPNEPKQTVYDLTSDPQPANS